MWNSTLTYIKKWICSSSLTNLFGSLSNSQRTWDFWSPSSIHNPPILHQVPNYTQSIMNASLAFFNNLQHSKHNKKIQFKVIYNIKYMFCYEQFKFSFRMKKPLSSTNMFTQLTILLPPLMKMVTALELLQSSITNILSLVVPNDSSLTIPAFPNFSFVSSSNRGTILPPVAMAIN